MTIADHDCVVRSADHRIIAVTGSSGLVPEARVDDGGITRTGDRRPGRAADVTIARPHLPSSPGHTADVTVTIADRQRKAVMDDAVGGKADVGGSSVGVPAIRVHQGALTALKITAQNGREPPPLAKDEPPLIYP